MAQNINAQTTLKRNFLFSFSHIENVSYAVTLINIPAVTLGETIAPTPEMDISYPGSKIQFDPIQLTFLVDEDFANYIEIFDWMTQLRKWNTLNGLPTPQAPSVKETDGMYDAHLTILSNNLVPLKTVVFKSCWPSFLGQVDFLLQESGEAQTCDLTLQFTEFEII